MEIKLIVIGDELLSGRIVDKNGPWLINFLKQKGIGVKTITIVGDNEKQLVDTLKDHKNYITIISGGLGPTKDDITKSVISKAFNLPLEIDLKAQDIVKLNYERRGKSWDHELNFYNLIPKTITPLNNPSGLAPGLAKIEKDFALFCLPGVPIEFISMFESEVFPLMLKDFNLLNSATGYLNIRTYGIPEEKIFGLDLWDKLSEFGKVASLPHALGVDIEISQIENPDYQNEISKYIESTSLKDHIWQYGNIPLEDLVVKLAQEKNITIGLAESCTGGLVAHRITNVAGCSSHFQGSIVSYSNAVKNKMLEVKEETLNTFGTVSEETAIEMAKGAAKNLNADLTISLTGIAGPDGGSVEKPVGTVAIGWFLKGETGSQILNLKGNRKNLKYLFSQKGLFNMLFLLREGRL